MWARQFIFHASRSSDLLGDILPTVGIDLPWNIEAVNKDAKAR
jgi:hypothetical protein